MVSRTRSSSFGFRRITGGKAGIQVLGMPVTDIEKWSTCVPTFLTTSWHSVPAPASTARRWGCQSRFGQARIRHGAYVGPLG